MDAEWTLTLRQVFQDVQLQAIESSSYVRNPSGVAHQRTLAPAVRRLNALFSDEVCDNKQGVVEEAFLVFLDEMWLAVVRVMVAPKMSDVVLLAISSLVGEFLYRKSNKSKELKGKGELRLELLQKLMEATKAEDRVVRLRACHMLQLIVNRLDFIEPELRTQLKNVMLKRLNDKLTSVRIQSVYGLRKLQTMEKEDEKEDQVTRELRTLIVSDPSKDVRKAALSNIIVTSKTYPDLLVRIRDVNEDVRYAAFRTIGTALPMSAIPMTDRAQLLDQGLQDRATRVRKACEQMVLKKWFPECNSSPILLLKALEIEQYPQIGSKVARILLQHFADAFVGKDQAVAFNALEFLSENSGALNAESIFFWREQCHYYQQIDKEPEKAAALLPNVSDFSKLLVTACKAQSGDALFIAQQLLELGHLLDFQDEFGRRNLLDSLQNLLRDLETDCLLIKGIMELMAFVYSGSSEQEFIQVVAEIISDMYDPVEASNQDTNVSQSEDTETMNQASENAAMRLNFGPQLHKLSDDEREAVEMKFEELEKRLETLELESEEYTKVQTEMLKLEALLQDPKVLSWLRCLEIVAQLLKLTSHSLNDPVVDGMGRYILPAIDSDVPALREAGLENLGLFCLLDKRIAERYLIVFWRALNNPDEETEVKHTCIQAILDAAFSFSHLEPHIFGTKPSDEAIEEEKKDDEQMETAKDAMEKADDRDEDQEMEKENDKEPLAVAQKLDLDTIFIGLAELISVDDLDLQSTIVEGFCRLFMMNRIENVTVLAILLETFFSPKLQHVQHRGDHGFQSRSLQLLSLFFPAFVLASAANCMLLEEAATHLIQKSMEKLELESDKLLDLGACAKYVFHLLSHKEQEEQVTVRKKHRTENRRCAHHNRLGITICLEMLALNHVAASPRVHPDVVLARQKTLMKMLAWVEVTREEERSAALFKSLVQEICSSCFHAQKGLLRSAEAVLKRTCASLKEQKTEETGAQHADALAQDQAWALGLVKEREDVLQTVVLKASTEHEKWLKKQEREKKAQRRRTARYVSSNSSESSESAESEEEQETAAPARRQLVSRRCKTAAVNRMHEKEGEFEAKIKQALQDDDADEEEEEDEDEDEESESDGEEEDGSENAEDDDESAE